MEHEEALSRKQLATMLKVDITTLYRYEKQGLITPVWYVNGRPRYSLKSLLKIVKVPPTNDNPE
jgi:predicted site-specific integrase-resolvase